MSPPIPIPIVIVGRNPNIANTVRESLAPEYDVIHIITSLEAALAEIPLLLRGDKLPEAAQEHKQTPLAIAIGGGYDDQAFKQMRDACLSDDKCKVVPWLRPDMSETKGGPPDVSDAEAYGRKVGERVKRGLDGLGLGADEGKEKEREEEWRERVYYF